MKTFLRFGVVTSMVFLALCLLNALFHGPLAGDYFKAELAGVTLPNEKNGPWATALAYLILAAALAGFTIRGFRKGQGGLDGFLLGAGLGLLSSATLNLTNYAYVPGWGLGVSLLDMTWHSLSTAACGVLAAHVYAWALDRYGR